MNTSHTTPQNGQFCSLCDFCPDGSRNAEPINHEAAALKALRQYDEAGTGDLTPAVVHALLEIAAAIWQTSS